MATNFLDQLIGYGDEATRDALTLSTGEEGALWLNTDTGKVERWSGAAWQGLTITAEGILASPTDSYVLTADSSQATGLAWSEIQARKVEAYVKNDEATSLTKGEVVYISGGGTTAPLVKRAKANSETTAARTIGFATGTITASGFGYAQTHGLITGVNTAGFADGDVLYLSAATAGAYTNVRPTQPNHGVVVGITVKGGSAGAGVIFVLVQNGRELEELHDVLITSLAGGQLLRWNSTSSVWENFTPTGGLSLVFNGANAAIDAGMALEVVVPYACTITKATLLADTSTTTTVDVQTSSYAGYDTTSSICGGSKPAISAALKSQNTTLTGWTTALTAGSVLRAVVDANDNATRLTLHLDLTV